MTSKSKIFSDGEVLYDDDLNNNIYMPLLSYNTTDQASSFTTNTSSTQLKTLSVDADAITKDVIVKVLLSVRSAYGTGGGSRTGTFDIKLDSVTKDTFTITALGADPDVSTVETRLITYKITPTSTQISNGFTISVYGKIDSSAGAGSRVGVVGWDILGA